MPDTGTFLWPTASNEAAALRNRQEFQRSQLAELASTVFEDIAFQVLDLHDRLLIKPTCFATSLVYSGSMETKKCPGLVVDRRCGLELFHVSTEEPTSDSPPLELWECVRGHRMHFVSKKEESKSEAENSGGPL
jgi:hypothetical protein